MSNLTRIQSDMIVDPTTGSKVSDQIGSLSGVNSNTVSYTYDSLGNVQSVTVKDSGNNVLSTTTYTYDSNGNVTQSVLSQSGKTITTNYTYDVSGNITSTSNTMS